MTGISPRGPTGGSAELLEHIRCAVVRLTPGLDVDDMNPQAERTYGAIAEDVQRSSFLERFVPRESWPEIGDALARAVEGEDLDWREHTFLTLDGGPRRLMWRPVWVEEPPGVLIISQDVTELRAAESQVHELEGTVRERRRLADLGTLAAKIVHDLGGPVTVISALVEQLDTRVKHQPATPVGALESSVGGIRNAAERMRTMLRGCLQATRAQHVQRIAIELETFLREIASAWDPEASRRGLAVDVDAEPGVVFRGDPDKLRRVLDNLVQNAIEAIDHGPGRVSLCGSRGPRGVVISVADTGPGIPPGMDVYGLFETTKEDGTGLGLAIAKELVVGHGGSIRHGSREPHGAVFTIELPADADFL